MFAEWPTYVTVTLLELHYHTIPYHRNFFFSHWKKITLSKSSGSLKQTNNEISGKFEKDNTVDFTVNWNLMNLFLDASPLCASLNWKYFLTVTLFAFPFCKTVITLWSFPLNVKYFPSRLCLSCQWVGAKLTQQLYQSISPTLRQSQVCLT